MTDNRVETEKPDIDVLREEIRQTRADLGDTVQALAAKADVKARVTQSAVEAGHRVRESAVEAGQWVRESATRTATQAWDPTAARRRMVAVGRSVRERPVPWLALAGGVGAAAVIGYVIARGRRR